MFARTERLLLRPGWSQDAPALFEAIAEEAVVRNLASAPWPYALADAESFLATERDAGAPAAMIFRCTDGASQLVGTIGIGSRPDGELELGYFIAKPFWGRGYATEAGRAMLAFARDGLRLRKLSAGYFLDNPASGRVLEKLGFRPTGAIGQRYSAGRREIAASRLLELELAEPESRVAPRDCMEMMAA